MIHTSLQAREIIAKKTLQFIPSPFVAYNIWTSSAPDLAINGSSDRFRFSPDADSKPEHEPTFNISLYIKEPETISVLWKIFHTRSTSLVLKHELKCLYASTCPSPFCYYMLNGKFLVTNKQREGRCNLNI